MDQSKEEISKKKQEIKKASDAGYLEKLKRARAKIEYIQTLVKARYFLERCNMMAVQLKSGDICERVDDCLKSKDFMRAEYAMTKVQAITQMRNVFFMKEDMVKDFGLTDGDFEAIEKDYYDGKIIRESYDDEYRKKDKARFVEEFKKSQS